MVAVYHREPVSSKCQGHSEGLYTPLKGKGGGGGWGGEKKKVKSPYRSNQLSSKGIYN